MNEATPIPARDAVAGVRYRNARATSVLTLVALDMAAGTATMKDEKTEREAPVPLTYLLFPMNDTPSAVAALVGAERATFDAGRLAPLKAAELDELEDADPRAWLVAAIDAERQRRIDPFGEDEPGRAAKVGPAPKPAPAPVAAPAAPVAPVLVTPTPEAVAANLAAADAAKGKPAPAADDVVVAPVAMVNAREGRLFDNPLTSRIADFLAAAPPDGRGLDAWPRGYPEALAGLLGKVPEFRAQVAPTDAPASWSLATVAEGLRLDVGQILQDAHDFESRRGEDLRPSFLDLIRRAHNNARKVFPGAPFDPAFAAVASRPPAPAPTTTSPADVPVTPSTTTARPVVDDLSGLAPLDQIERVSVARALEIIEDLRPADVSPTDVRIARGGEESGRKDRRVIDALTRLFDQAARARQAARTAPATTDEAQVDQGDPVDRAAEEGAAAGEDGVPANANPYDAGTPEGVAWADGWNLYAAGDQGADEDVVAPAAPPVAPPVTPAAEPDPAPEAVATSTDFDVVDMVAAFSALGRAAASGALARAGVRITITIGGGP